MPTHFLAHTHIHRLRIASIFVALLGLSACAAAPTTSNETPPAETVDAPVADASATETAFVAPEPVVEKKAPQPVETAQVSIDVSCKNEPYGKYEKQSRISIEKGLSATVAGTYGVGFRNLDEHKKWSGTHNALFTAVNSACTALNQCAKKNPKDKTKQCAQPAKNFTQWQNLSKQFAEKARLSETTQPPQICSFTANLDDAASCFHALADNVDNTCNSSTCKETSDCWRGVGFLDGAINQATSACTFIRTPLAECRGYVTVSQRRKTKFERCTQMQKNLNVRIIPVL